MRGLRIPRLLRFQNYLKNNATRLRKFLITSLYIKTLCGLWTLPNISLAEYFLSAIQGTFARESAQCQYLQNDCSL